MILQSWKDLVSIIASVCVILGAVGMTARWAIKDVVEDAVAMSVNPLKEEMHSFDIRLARVEEKVDALEGKFDAFYVREIRD